VTLPAFGSPAGEIVRALLLGGAFAVVIALASLWRRVAMPPVEWTRKAIHAGCGLLLLGLPWWIARLETLAVLTLLALVALMVARRAGWLPGLFAVERESRGELYFPIAVLPLFAIGRAEPVL
jgi:phytol kinase